MNIRDIAERAGYGVSTVSRVINGQSNVSDQARERILAVMDACGYEPNTNARYLKMRSPSPVAVFVMGTSNRLFGDILARIQARFWALGEEVAVTHLEDDANEVQFAISYQQTRHPKAMLFLGGERTYFREAFGQITVPSVLITNTAEGLGFENLSSVTIDNEAAAARAIDYLHAAGHRRIGILGGTRSPEQIGGRRLEGAESALMAHGIVFSRIMSPATSPKRRDTAPSEGFSGAPRTLPPSSRLETSSPLAPFAPSTTEGAAFPAPSPSWASTAPRSRATPSLASPPCGRIPMPSQTAAWTCSSRACRGPRKPCTSLPPSTSSSRRAWARPTPAASRTFLPPLTIRTGRTARRREPSS